VATSCYKEIKRQVGNNRYNNQFANINLTSLSSTSLAFSAEGVSFLRSDAPPTPSPRMHCIGGWGGNPFLLVQYSEKK
jgi:hypothetical protein